MKKVAHRMAFVLLVAQVGLLAAWPWLAGTPVREALTPGYSALCHQRPERCLVHGGEPMPVCARCLGVWLGLLLAATLGTRGRLWGTKVGLALVGWMVASWVLRLPQAWHLERVAAGVAGGVGVYVLANRVWAAARLWQPWRQPFFRRCWYHCTRSMRVTMSTTLPSLTASTPVWPDSRRR